MKRFYLLVILFVFSKTMSSQDIHFTMFHAVPVLMNPSAAGLFEGDFRASLNYKTQWGSISKPFKTYACTIDGSLIKNRNGKSIIGIALTAFRDVAGASNFGVTKLNLTLSSIIHLGKWQTASLGFTGGWGQTSMQPDNLEWDSQFNGQVFNSSLPSNETYSFQNKQYVDFSTGVTWAYGKPASTLSSNDRFNAQIGAAIHHISKPEFSAYSSKNEKLYSRIALHANFHVSTNQQSRIAFRPRFQAFLQGPATEINAGLMMAYLLQDGSKYTQHKRGYAINFGFYYRFRDSFSPSIEIEMGPFTVGYAYDTNLSGLTKVTYGRGGSEIFLKFQNPNKFLRFSSKRSYI